MFGHCSWSLAPRSRSSGLLYGHPWDHYSGGYQYRLLSGPLGLLNLGCTTPAGVERKDYRGNSTRLGIYTCPNPCKVLLIVHDEYSSLKPTCNPASRSI
jgi:hypothetical protein